jgi:hypothetical protein
MIVGLFPQTGEGDTTMADRPRMTAAQLMDKLLASEHADLPAGDGAGWHAERYPLQAPTGSS